MKSASQINMCAVALLILGCANVAQEGHTEGSPLTQNAKLLPVDAHYSKALNEAVELSKNDQLKAAEMALTKVIANEAFHRLTIMEKYTAYSHAGRVTYKLDKYAQARHWFAKAIDTDPSQSGDWYLLGLAHLGLDEASDAAYYVSMFAHKWPERANIITVKLIQRLYHDSQLNLDAKVQLLQSLFSAHWQENRPSTSYFWLQLALAKIARNEIEAVKQIIPRIDGPRELVVMQVDRRFDPYQSLLNTNPEKAAENRLRILRGLSLIESDNLETQNDLLNALMALGKHEEVLDISDALLMLLDAREEATFADTAAQAWIMDNRSLALMRLQRWDEALEQSIQASKLSEYGAPNASQVLNLGHYYVTLGRPDDALKTISAVGEMNDYGEMVLHAIRHRAAVQKKRLYVSRCSAVLLAQPCLRCAAIAHFGVDHGQFVG